MGTKERKEREKEELKQKILDAAFKIVNKEGYQALTIRKLADLIEYSPRTIYLYYKDKEDLLRAIVEYGFAFTVRNLEANDYYRGLDPEEQLKTSIANHLRLAAGNINYYNTVVHVIQGAGFEPGPNQLIVERYVAESLVPCFIQEGATSEFSVFFLFSSLRGIAVEWINRKPPQNEEEINRTIEMVWGFYRNLLRVKKGDNHGK